MDKMKETLLLIVCLASATAKQDLEVTVQSESITAITGTSQTFRCYYNINSTASDVMVVWSKYISRGSFQYLWGAKYTAASSGSYSKIVGYGNPKVTGAAASSAMLSSHYITIPDIEQQDAGQYNCYVHYWQDRQRYGGYSPKITLTVHTSPQPKLRVYSYDTTGASTPVIVEAPSSAASSASTPPETQTSIEIATKMTTVPSGSSVESRNLRLIGGIAGAGVLVVVVIVVLLVLRKRKSAETPDSDDQEMSTVTSTNAHTAGNDPDEPDLDPTDVENQYAKPDLSRKQKHGAGAKPAVEAKPQKPVVPIKRFPDEKNEQEQKEQDAVTGLTSSSRDSTLKPERTSPKSSAAKAKEKPKPSVAFKPVTKVPDKQKSKKPAPPAVPQGNVRTPKKKSRQDERHDYYNIADITASRSSGQHQILEAESQTYAQVLPSTHQPRLNAAKPVADTEYFAVQFRPDGRRNDDLDSD